METIKSLYVFLMWYTKAQKPYLWGHRLCLGRQCWIQEVNFSHKTVNETHPWDHIMEKPRENPYTWHYCRVSRIISSIFCIYLNSVNCNYPILRNKVPNILFLSTFLLLQPDVWIHLWNIIFLIFFFPHWALFPSLVDLGFSSCGAH